MSHRYRLYLSLGAIVVTGFLLHVVYSVGSNRVDFRANSLSNTPQALSQSNILSPVIAENDSEELPPPIKASSRLDESGQDDLPSAAEIEKAKLAQEKNLLAYRTKRIANGNRPVEQQAIDLAARFGIDVDEVKDNASVVVTLETPMPFEFYETRGRDAAKTAFENQFNVTVYAELDNGYPLTMTGKPDFNYMGSMTAMLEQIRTSFDDSRDPSWAQRQWDSDMAANAVAATYNLVERSVVLGFSAPYRQFSKQEDLVKRRYSVKAAEVTLNEYAPPIGFDGRVDVSRVAEFLLVHSYSN